MARWSPLVPVLLPLLAGALRATLVAPPEMPPTPGGGPAVLVRYDSAVLEPAGDWVQRWYRLIRVGGSGDLGTPLELLSPRGTREIRVLVSRRLRGATREPVAWELVRPGGASPRGERRLEFATGSLVAGDLLEVLVERRATSVLAGLDFAPAHSFGTGSPVGRDLFEVRVPRGVSLRYLARGLGAASRPVLTREGEQEVYLWSAEHLPPSEGPSGERPYVRTTRLENWDQVAGWYRPRLQARITAPPEVVRRAEDWGKGARSRRELVSRLLAGVSFEIPYRHQLDGSEADLCGRSAATVLRRGSGNCADKSNLLAAMLLSQGIEAHPVLTADSRTWPLDPEVPGFLPGDHVLVRARLGGETFFLDPTEPGYLLGTLPPRLRKVVVWDPFTGEFLATPGGGDPGEDLLDRHVQARIDSRGELEGELRVRARGRPGAQLRRLLHRKPGGGELAALMLPPGTSLQAVQTSGPLDLEEALEVRMHFRGRLPVLGDGRIFLRPPFPPPVRRVDQAPGPGERMLGVRILETADLSLAPDLEVRELAPGGAVEGGASRVQVSWRALSPGRLEFLGDYRRRGPEPDPEVAEARSSLARRVVVLAPREPSQEGPKP